MASSYQSALRISRWQRLRRAIVLGGIIAGLILFIRAGNFFTSTRLQLNNIYFVSRDTSDTVVIVALDDDSLAEYGRSPVEWSRTVYADLIAILNESGARVVAFDMMFAEATPDDEALIQAIQQARQGAYNKDGIRTRTLMPLIGLQIAENADADYHIRFSSSLAPQPDIAASVDNLAYVNTFPDVDGVMRRIPSFIETPEGEQRLSFSMATFLSYSGIPAIAIPQLLETENGMLKITPDITPDRKLTIDDNGFWVQNFFGTAPDSFPVVSLHEVLNGEADTTIFYDKIVLVGLMNASGLVDRYNVPLGIQGRSMAGVEIHANAIETLIQKNALREQGLLSHILMIVLLSIGTSILYSYLRWYWMLAGMLLIALVFTLFAFVVFDAQNYIIDLFYGWLAILLPPPLILGTTITIENRRRRQAEFLLASVFEVSNQRLELDNILPRLAQDIQRISGAESSTGTIWLCDEDNQEFRRAYTWPASQSELSDTLPALCQQVKETRKTLREGHHIALPILWLRRMSGIIDLNIQTGQRINRDSQNLLKALAEQAAPNIENAMLYTETQQQNALLQGILSGAPGSIVVLDRDQTILQINSSFDYEFDMDSADYIHKPFGQLLMAVEITDNTIDIIHKQLNQAQVFRQEIKISKSNKVFYMDAALLESIQKWVVVISNVTGLAELSELKTQMIRMASHDLKNPLGSIIGYTELLTDQPGLPDMTRRFLNNVDRAANNMLHIINDILNLEQLRVGKVQREPVNMKALMEQVLEHHIGDAQMKQQTLTPELADDLPFAAVDFRMFSQAVNNLVGNAVKYTPDGGQITARLFAKDENTLRLEVQDNGYGMPKDAQDKLFTQFYRVRTPATAHIKGTGLGLSLVKSIIESHEGQIWVESDEGKGSTFYVEIPFQAEDGESHAQAE